MLALPSAPRTKKQGRLGGFASGFRHRASRGVGLGAERGVSWVSFVSLGVHLCSSLIRSPRLAHLLKKEDRGRRNYVSKQTPLWTTLIRTSSSTQGTEGLGWVVTWAPSAVSQSCRRLWLLSRRG